MGVESITRYFRDFEYRKEIARAHPLAVGFVSSLVIGAPVWLLIGLGTNATVASKLIFCGVTQAVTSLLMLIVIALRPPK